jgi:hypothetical protein
LTSPALRFKMCRSSSPDLGFPVMTIRFNCPSCGHSLKCGDEVAGKRVKCTRCPTVTTAPIPITNPEIVTNDPPALSAWQPAEPAAPSGNITEAAPPVLSARAESISPHENDKRELGLEGIDNVPDRKPNSTMAWLFGIGTVSVLLVVLVCAGGGALLFGIGILASSSNNAKCPACGRQFHIAEEHRGTIAEWTRDYRCPNCGSDWPAGLLYRTKDADMPQRTHTPTTRMVKITQPDDD